MSFLQAWPRHPEFILPSGSGRGWCRALLIFHSRKPQTTDFEFHVACLCLGFQKNAFIICWNRSQATLEYFDFSSLANERDPAQEVK